MLVEMGSENQSSVKPGELELGIDGNRKSGKSDSFVVEMDMFEKDINGYSRSITLQRNLSRKGSGKCGEKKINSILGANERDACLLSTSPRATLHGRSTPEKPIEVVALGATDHSTTQQPHHQITINGSSTGNTAVESKCGNKRFSFRRSPPFLTVDPRRILVLFATLSSIGTIILIYFTLSMTKINGDDNAQRWLNLLRGTGQDAIQKEAEKKKLVGSRGIISWIFHWISADSFSQKQIIKLKALAESMKNLSICIRTENKKRKT